MCSPSMKYYEWMVECANIINSRNSEIQKRRIAVAFAVIAAIEENKRRKYKKKKYWVAEIFENRAVHGFYHAMFPILRLEDSRFINYCRMSATEFEELLCLVGPTISKQYVVRDPISAPERLALTLRFLASGDSMTSLSYQYLVGITTVSNIIKETCQAIWNALCPVVLKPNMKAEWLAVSKSFNEKCQFPHCIGALDGKHITIQCPNKSGSAYYNYKGAHSIVLLAMCDANYIFVSIDIGAYGRQSDGGIFKHSLLGQKLEANTMDLPAPKPLWENGPDLPYVIVADEAFPLTPYLLRPYSGKDGLSTEQRIYNYRLSRARRMIENLFGILASQWRIFRRPILASVENVIKIVQATICLHNFLRMSNINNAGNYGNPELVDREDENYDIIPGQWRCTVTNNNAFNDIVTSCRLHDFPFSREFLCA
ncbi:uncharacterized protein [Temnothorax nylanderi]|uniref:uncharacterized protein n=1 Tax=Temnothorax nylanderi TaxID=102681 RepID=UPI003A86B0BC